MTLQRLALDFRTGGLVVRCLYRTEGEAGANTKARRREVSALTREGLSAVLEALEGSVDVVGRRGSRPGKTSSYVQPKVTRAWVNIRQYRKEPSGRSTRRCRRCRARSAHLQASITGPETGSRRARGAMEGE